MTEQQIDLSLYGRRELWERSWIAEDGVRVFRCTKQGCIRPVQMFNRWYGSTRNFWCQECNNRKNKEKNLIGFQIRHEIMLQDGGCVWVEDDGTRCGLRYPEHLRGNFALDHIDPTLKQHLRETHVSWIACNQDEFFTRVRPNLQTLCQHHNAVKNTKDHGIGGKYYVAPWSENFNTSDAEYEDMYLVLPGMESFVNPLT